MKQKRRLAWEDYKILRKPVDKFNLEVADLFLACSGSFWHNGIHLAVSEESVKNVYDGKIVACRYSSGYKTKKLDLCSLEIREKSL